MSKQRHRRLTPLEALVMDAVWTLSEATVHQVREYLAPRRPLAYNSVLTVLRILRDKGFLKSRRSGRADVYVPLVSRQSVGKRSLHEVLTRFFSSSATALVSQLLDSPQVSPDEIRAIRREIDRRLAKRKAAGEGG